MILKGIQEAAATGDKLLAVLVDPDKFDASFTSKFLNRLPKSVTHLFVGGSTVVPGLTGEVIGALKKVSQLPLVLFPGDSTHISSSADGILFLSLLSGRNPEYLIGQQLRAVPRLRDSGLEIIPTGYLLIEGGKETAVQKVTQTQPLQQEDVDQIVHTALAGEYSGKKLIYLEAGSGAHYPVGRKIIAAVKKAVGVPLIVGGGIRTEKQLQETYAAGADMVVMGTVFEENSFAKQIGRNGQP